MSKKSTETQAAAEILAKELGMLLDAVARETTTVEDIYDELRATSGTKIDEICWEALDHEAVITHPALQRVLSDHLKRMIDHITYTRYGALHERFF